MSCVLLFLLQYKVRKLRIKQNYCKKEIRHLYYLIEFLTIQHLRASLSTQILCNWKIRLLLAVRQCSKLLGKSFANQFRVTVLFY